jgi:hypothetical protein
MTKMDYKKIALKVMQSHNKSVDFKSLLEDERDANPSLQKGYHIKQANWKSVGSFIMELSEAFGIFSNEMNWRNEQLISEEDMKRNDVLNVQLEMSSGDKVTYREMMLMGTFVKVKAGKIMRDSNISLYYEDTEDESEYVDIRL